MIISSNLHHDGDSSNSLRIFGQPNINKAKYKVYIWKVKDFWAWTNKADSFTFVLGNNLLAMQFWLILDSGFVLLEQQLLTF